MEMSGEQTIPASKADVWAALNDPQVLSACIPGCESLEKTSDTSFSAVVTAKVGPVKAKFKGEVNLENIDAPNGYTLVGEGKGGVAGFAKGSADVTLAEDGDGTRLSYAVKAKVGGKLAQLGSRLIDSTAQKLAGEFFANFSRHLGGEPQVTETTEDENLAEVPLDEGLIEEAKEIAEEDAEIRAVEVLHDVEHSVEEAVKDAEEKVEIAAARGVWGGPMGWGLIALAAGIGLYLLLGNAG
ncbi:CoxG family protein [Polycladidibacter hongkongensis]|uniref:CoxG family protein n=1 Tax=Polycladidibacter hongkongensis TaxID=1647556 RepID=UPI00083667CD|nr:carbon monoxide dehydrogenase subunit G [Pseudovibrio hongkongensis]